MNSETLDRLLMDRALGTLSPEPAELLAAYLGRVPEAALRAAEFERAAAAARAALRRELPTALPRFPHDRIRRGQIRRLRFRIACAAGGLAAAIALGFGLGRGWSGGAAHAPSWPGPGATAGVAWPGESSAPAQSGLWSLVRVSESVRNRAGALGLAELWRAAPEKSTGGAL